MKTLILMLLCLCLFAPTSYAGSDPKCDSLLKVLKDLNKKSNNFVNKYKANIDSHSAETDRIVRGSAGDTTSARNLIARFKKDTAYFQRCLDTANAFFKAIQDNEAQLGEICGKSLGKKLSDISDQNTKILIYIEGFTDFAKDMLEEWEKKIKHTKKEHADLIKFYNKR